MGWSFTLYGIHVRQFEMACFDLLLQHGFTLDQCTAFATLFQREDRLQAWWRLISELRPHLNGDSAEAWEKLGVHEFGASRMWQNKNACFGLNKLTLWYVDRYSHVCPHPIVPYENGCFLADKAINDGIVDWVTTALAYVEQQSNPDFVWECWDIEYNADLIPQVEEYFGAEGWRSSEYREAFSVFYGMLRGLLKEDYDWYYWAHSY